MPGISSLYVNAEDERVTTDVLNQHNHESYPDQVYVVADATQLRRGLMLCMQVMDLGFPTVLVVNMIDLLEAEKMRLDTDALSHMLGIPVLSVSAVKGKGVPELKKRLAQEAPVTPSPLMNIPPGFQEAMNQLSRFVPQHNAYQRYQALLIDPPHKAIPVETLTQIRKQGKLDQKVRQQLISNELIVRLDRADAILEDAIQGPQTPIERWTERFDRLVTHPVWGYTIFIGILFLIFQSIFVWAEYPMAWIEMGMGALKAGVGSLMPEGWIKDLILEGILTGIEGIVIFVPQIAFLFFFISILEDSGYMARAVYIMDRIMRPFGFSGRSVIPLMGGMACAIPSIMMTRSISNPKERLITLLVTPLISCSARIPVYTLLIALF
ncbi:MAG: ferrous iron transporter B, partial [Bacteroidota bacterium]